MRFTTTSDNLWRTAPEKSHINYAILDSDWEGEFCRVAEAHPRVFCYAKNHNLGLEIPYRMGGEPRRYIPDFVLLVDDGHGRADPLHLLVEIKGFRALDAQLKKSAAETYWCPAVNNHGGHGRWAFAEFRDVLEMSADFAATVRAHFDQMLAEAGAG